MGATNLAPFFPYIGMEEIMKKVIIFGVGGFVGNYLAQEFLAHDYQVYGSDIVEYVKLDERVDYRQADLLDAGNVKQVIEDIAPDVIVNLAAISSVGMSWGMPQKTIEVNVVGALNIMEAARTLPQSPRILFVGSSEEYETTEADIDENVPLNANNPYGISKMTQENFAKLYRERYGMQIYCVRSFNHTGIGQKDTFVLPSFCKQVAEIEKTGKQGCMQVGNLTAIRDFSHVKDIVRAYRMIVESDRCDRIYNVGSGQAYSIREMLDYIISLCSQKVTVEVDPARVRPVDTPRICCDNRLIQAELGWQPEYTIWDAVKEMYQYYVEH